MTAKVGIVVDMDVKGEGELKAATKQLENLGDAGKKASPGVNKAGGAADSLDKKIRNFIAGGALVAAGKMLLDFGKASVNAASDVEEMQSKFNTVFKDLAGDVTNELQTFADASNRSIYDLQGFAATLQDTFVPLGFARDEAAKTSVEIVKLAEDLASFNNLNTADVVADLQSALVGNTETLRKYGVVATQAAIDQKALEMGLEFTSGSMDAQTKAAAILALTMEGTTDAQGDAIRTADSYANVSKGTEAAITDLKVAIGQGLLPVMTDLKVQTAETAGELATLVSTKNLLATAVDKGIISQQEYVEIQLQAALSSQTLAEAGADVIQALEDEARAADEAQQALIDAGNAASSFDRAMIQNHQSTIRAKEAIIAYSAALAESRGENEELADKTAQLANHTGTAEQAMIAANLANEQYFESLKEQALAAEEAAAAQAELAAQLEQQEAGYFQNALAAQEAGNGQLDLNQAMYDAAAAAGASATELAVLGGALGLYSEEALDAALKTAAINVKIGELAQAYADGEISVSEMREELNDFIADLEATPEEAETFVGLEGIDDAVRQLDDLSNRLDSFNGRQANASVNVGVNDQTTGGGAGGSAGSGGVNQYATGTNGWQTVPGPIGAPVPMVLHGGESFNVIPVNQSGGGESSSRGNTVTISQVFNAPVTPQMAAMVQDSTAAALIEAGIKGF